MRLVIIEGESLFVDGLTLRARWRAGAFGVPVLVVAARCNWSEKARGIDGGTDDCLAKPLQMEELPARQPIAPAVGQGVKLNSNVPAPTP